MWDAITVLFCFPWAQRRLTSRRADRKGVHSRWIGSVTDTTLIAGTRVSNCPYKTAAAVNWSLQEFLQVWPSRAQKHKDRFTVLSVNHDSYLVCVPVSWTPSFVEVWLKHTTFREFVTPLLLEIYRATWNLLFAIMKELLFCRWR